MLRGTPSDPTKYPEEPSFIYLNRDAMNLAILPLLFSLVFALLGLVHVKWPYKIKQVTDYMARQFGTLRYTSRFDESYYRTIGWIYVVCAIAQVLGALALMATYN